jgi:hypothetical protein
VDGPGLADPAHVVPQQIDNHDVLGAVLEAVGELLGQPAILLRPAAPAARALHGPGFEPVAFEPEMQLRRRRQDLEAARVEVGAEVRVLGGGEPPVQGEGIAAEPGSEGEGVVDLVGVACGDVFPHPPHGSQVVFLGDAGLPGAQFVGRRRLRVGVAYSFI